ncbi:hypothetical protein PG993_002912 [Apiospora rasikravindrae]|uniref:Cyanovirin-N domain-containing protein n=1 Tax=Apiospora rasikravindrae TaxID=990691 RepID=A0ABR1TY39_9PEZI
MPSLNYITLSLWAIMTTAGYASIGSTIMDVSNNSSPITRTQTVSSPTPIIPIATLTSGTTFAISTITTSNKATATPLATAPGVEDALIYIRCDRFRINEGNDAQHGNIWLDAYCRDDAGHLWHSVINLNHCLQNYGGVLQPAADGDFATTCWSPKIEGAPATYMTVYCYPGDGRPAWQTAFDFGNSDLLSINAGGQFECLGISGCAWNSAGCNDKPDGVNG